MSAALRIIIGVGTVIALAALAASRLTVAHVLVGNPSAVTAASIETALNRYEADHGHYPPVDFDLDNLAAATNGGPYLIGAARDAWHRPYRYTLVSGKPRVYSAGPDGIFDTKDDIYAGGLTCKTRYVFR
jgi:hypothetical protein